MYNIYIIYTHNKTLLLDSFSVVLDPSQLTLVRLIKHKNTKTVYREREEGKERIGRDSYLGSL